MNTREILRTVAGSNGSVVLEWDGKGLDVWLASDDREETFSVRFEAAQVRAMREVLTLIETGSDR